jgi:phosphohistidine phosphatase
MELVLWRHADAAAGHPDAARTLTELGHEQAAASARWLLARLPSGFTLFASPALRAQQTARALRAPIRTEHTLAVGASALQLLETVGWDTGEGTIVVVGHQPTLGHTASLLISGEEDDWSFATSEICWIHCEDTTADIVERFDPGSSLRE